jgi:hypothetical protein
VKVNALDSQLFSLICEGMGSLLQQLLQHTEVCWLSCGKIVSQVFELHHELLLLLEDKNLTAQNYFRIKTGLLNWHI